MGIVKSIFKAFSGGTWDEYYFKTSSDQVVHTKTDGQSSTVKEELDAINGALGKIYPVGSIYMSTIDKNPSEYFGGTWVSWGSGRVPVGFDADDTAFNASEKTGGSRYMQAHTHEISLTTEESGNHSHRVVGVDGTNVSQNTTPNRYTMASGASTGLNGAAQANGEHTHKVSGDTESTGSGNQNNLQPYIVCYMWKRTA